MLGKMRRPSGTWIRPRATIAAGCSRSIAASKKRMAPRQARITPEMVRLSVDLPAPFEPSTATISPADSEIDAAQDFGLAIAGAQAADGEQGSAMGGRLRQYAAAAPWPR